MLPTVWERSTHSSTTKTVLASQNSESALVSIQPVLESTNYCPVNTSSMSTSRIRNLPPSPFQNHPPSPFRSGPLPFTGYESGQPVLKLASWLRNGLGCESGLNMYYYLHAPSSFWVMRYDKEGKKMNKMEIFLQRNLNIMVTQSNSHLIFTAT